MGSPVEFIFHFILILVIISVTVKATLHDRARDIARKGLGCFAIGLAIVLVVGFVIFILPYIFG